MTNQQPKIADQQQQLKKSQLQYSNQQLQSNIPEQEQSASKQQQSKIEKQLADKQPIIEALQQQQSQTAKLKPQTGDFQKQDKKQLQQEALHNQSTTMQQQDSKVEEQQSSTEQEQKPKIVQEQLQEQKKLSFEQTQQSMSEKLEQPKTVQQLLSRIDQQQPTMDQAQQSINPLQSTVSKHEQLTKVQQIQITETEQELKIEGHQQSKRDLKQVRKNLQQEQQINIKHISQPAVGHQQAHIAKQQPTKEEKESKDKPQQQLVIEHQSSIPDEQQSIAYQQLKKEQQSQEPKNLKELSSKTEQEQLPHTQQTHQPLSVSELQEIGLLQTTELSHQLLPAFEQQFQQPLSSECTSNTKSLPTPKFNQETLSKPDLKQPLPTSVHKLQSQSKTKKQPLSIQEKNQPVHGVEEAPPAPKHQTRLQTSSKQEEESPLKSPSIPPQMLKAQPKIKKPPPPPAELKNIKSELKPQPPPKPDLKPQLPPKPELKPQPPPKPEMKPQPPPKPELKPQLLPKPKKSSQLSPNPELLSQPTLKPKIVPNLKQQTVQSQVQSKLKTNQQSPTKPEKLPHDVHPQTSFSTSPSKDREPEAMEAMMQALLSKDLQAVVKGGQETLGNTSIPRDLPKCLYDTKRMGNIFSREKLDENKYLDDGEEEVEYLVSQREVFQPYMCHVCQVVVGQTPLKRCTNCKMIFYCSKEHQTQHWPMHKDLCKAICKACTNVGASHLYEAAYGFTADKYKHFRIECINNCASELGRPLELWEREMFYYTPVCNTCYESDKDKLITCSKCLYINYCKPEHLNESHSKWCGLFELHKDILLYQAKNGMIQPSLPNKVFDEHQSLMENNMRAFLVCVIGSSICTQWNKLTFAVLTDVATCPLTTLFALEHCQLSTPLALTKSLTIHMVGAELHFEADTLKKWELFLLHLLPNLRSLRLVFVGPELKERPLAMANAEKCCSTCRKQGREVLCEFEPGRFYHDYVGSTNYKTPDLICAFNAGLYRATGYAESDTWPPTIKAMLQHKNVPIVVTAYTSQELPLDVHRMKEYCPGPLQMILQPTENPYSSTKPSLNFVNEEDVPIIFKNFYIAIVKCVTNKE